MQRQSSGHTTYQYPDPDDLDEGARYSWAGDDHDYVPEALRQAPSTDWPASSAEYNDYVRSPRGDIWRQGDRDPMEIGNEDPVEDDRSSEHLVDSDEEVMIDEQDEDSHLLGRESARAAVETRGNYQRRDHHASASQGRRLRRGGLGKGHKGMKRGPRDAIEPEPEFKELISKATMAFIANDYDEAESLTLQALQINPEMYQAHSLLSEIHAARGDLDKALSVLYSGAHTQPRNVEMWSKIARMVLDRDEKHTTATLRDALYCYNRIVTVDKTNVEAHFQRAALHRELGNLRRVVTEYEILNKYLPHDTTVLRHLAQASIEINEPDRALKLYNITIDHFQELEPLVPVSFTWSDVHVLVELYLFRREYDKGLELTKSLSRWLLGRRNDHCWESHLEDDREWDLNDHPRRTEFSDFVPNLYEVQSYGAGLPLELRIKLGILRLNLGNQDFGEAINHFEWLDPADNEIGAKLFDYHDLFRDVARSLMEKGLYEEAIRFYEPLRQIPDDADSSFISDLARCYTMVGRTAEVEALQSSLQDFDVDNGDEDYSQSDSIEFENEVRKSFITASNPAAKRTRKRAEKEKENLDFLQDLFNQRESIKEASQQDQMHLSVQWKSVTQRLVQRFMQEKAFLQDSKNHQPMEAGQQARHPVKKKAREKNSMVDSGPLIYSEPNESMTIRMFAGIAFNEWLEILLEYGLSLAYEGNLSQAYQVIAFATQANVFNEIPDSLFLIHVCWFSCALLNSDDETLCTVCRWFMRDYQFVGDAYRLFSALNRLCDSEIGWYNCGPSQKHILRQVKAMDFALADNARATNTHQERSAYTAKDIDGNIILPQTMDVSLLMLYGHVLYAGKSYAYANNYFLRALSIDPENSIIKLSLALGYIHHALKRQADNRHQLIMQGLAFLFEYYNRRRQEGGASEQQEAAYNVGRAFHLLGLTHLATSYYEDCLVLSDSVRDEYDEISVEDLAHEAAVALQGIWATNGNEAKALELTERWLHM